MLINSFVNIKGVNKNYINNFYHNFKVDQYLSWLKTKPENYWRKKGEEMALMVFHLSANRVPAYQEFLKKHKINPAKIKKIKDFEQIPLMDKKNYLRQYKLEDLCWDGQLEKNDIVSVSSGSTGQPFLWPRGSYQEYEVSCVHEAFLKDFFKIAQKRTLFVVGYGIGMYVAGMCTAGCVWRIAEKGYPLINVMPGLNKDDIIRVIEELGEKTDQVILAAYPPIAKDVIDAGMKRGINWKKYHLKFIFGGESFSEEWRDYLCKQAGVENMFTDFMNTVGSADATVLGHETPVSIMVRRLAAKNRQIFNDLFGTRTSLPGLYQYNPSLRYFEQIDGRLIFTALGGIPLIRYDIGDGGGIISRYQITEALKRSGVDYHRELKQHHLENQDWQLPFLYLTGRVDLTMTLYGINIYPESIKDALGEQIKQGQITGRIAMFTKNNKKQDQYLEVNIELAEGISSSVKIKRGIQKAITGYLLKNYVEYPKLYSAIGRKAEPKIVLWPNNHPKYFEAKNRMGKSLVLKAGV